MNEELMRAVGNKIFPYLGFSPTELLWQRLARVVQQEARRAGAVSVDEFLRRAIQGERSVLEAICHALTINETYFFREPKHFEALRQLLPELAKVQQPPRILSAGCSSGEEAYSLAITAKDVLDPLGIPFEVLGVDFDREALERARAACYRQWSFRDQGLELARRHLEPRGELWCVHESIKQRVRFEQVNLIEQVPSGPFAVIFCRNTLMYFTNEHRARIVQRFTETLLPNGVLFIGSAETLEQPPAELERTSLAGAYFYRKRERRQLPAAASRLRVLLLSSTPLSRIAIRQALRLVPEVELIGEVRSVAEARAKLEEEGRAVVLVDTLETTSHFEQLAHLQGWPLVVLTVENVPLPRDIPSVVIPELTPGAVRRVLPDLTHALQGAKAQSGRRLPRQSAPLRTTGLLPNQTLAKANGQGSNRTIPSPGRRPAERLVLIGSSTGGPAVVTDILSQLPNELGLGILVVQHMPPNFTRSFAERLSRSGHYAAREAEDGELLMADTVLVAPGGKNVLLTRAGRVQVVPAEPGDLYIPNVNRTFLSAARSGLAPRVLAIILTGMGDDGAVGMAELASAGAMTLVQRPEEAVVAGMIEAALARKGVQKIVATADIPSEIVRWAQRSPVTVRNRAE